MREWHFFCQFEADFGIDDVLSVLDYANKHGYEGHRFKDIKWVLNADDPLDQKFRFLVSYDEDEQRQQKIIKQCEDLASPRWWDIKERKPKEYHAVWIYTEHYDPKTQNSDTNIHLAYCIYREDHYKWYPIRQELIMGKITHWKELLVPKPPNVQL